MNLTPLMAGGATMALCVGFSMPIGRERGYGTTYARFAGLTARFTPAAAPTGSKSREAAEATAAAEAPVGFSSSAGTQTPAAGARPGGGALRLPRARWKHPAKAGDALADVGVSTLTASAVPQRDQTPISAPSPLDGSPQAAPRPAAARMDDSPEALRDAFESDPSKFPLDAKAWSEGVFLRLAGLCKVKPGYIVKVTVTNRSGADFFVQELGAYSGEDLVSIRSHIRLFVEPGRTRDGYVVVAPPPGAQVKIKLKEDREKGRVLEVPVRYPF